MSMTINEQELFDNPTARVAICLVLDVSSSMYGAPINELNQGVQLFFDAIRNDDMASYSADISIVTFGSQASKIVDFASIERQQAPMLSASGTTAMGSGVNLALDLLEARKQEYKDAGVDYHQPWMVLMTDGEPTDNIIQASARTSQLINERKLTIFPIGIGSGANLSVLKQFSPKRQPLPLKGLNFKQFFEWLSKSIIAVSASSVGNEIRLDTSKISDWATL